MEHRYRLPDFTKTHQGEYQQRVAMEDSRGSWKAQFSYKEAHGNKVFAKYHPRMPKFWLWAEKKSLNKFILSFIYFVYVCVLCLGSNVHICVGAFVCEYITTCVHVCFWSSGFDIRSLQSHPPPWIPKQVLFLNSEHMVWPGLSSQRILESCHVCIQLSENTDWPPQLPTPFYMWSREQNSGPHACDQSPETAWRTF